MLPQRAPVVPTALLLACYAVSALPGQSPQAIRPALTDLDAVDAATRATWLIDGTVVDAETRKPIADFVVTPGTMSTDDQGKTTVRWRDNLRRDMSEGEFRWPRTSGFSVMRFRVTADGYRPAVTQRIWRGGPHTRIVVALARRPTATESN